MGLQRLSLQNLLTPPPRELETGRVTLQVKVETLGSGHEGLHAVPVSILQLYTANSKYKWADPHTYTKLYNLHTRRGAHIPGLLNINITRTHIPHPKY